MAKKIHTASNVNVDSCFLMSYLYELMMSKLYPKTLKQIIILSNWRYELIKYWYLLTSRAAVYVNIQLLLKKKNNFHDLTCAIVHCICEWAHEDKEWHLTTLLPLLHIICQITLPKLENMTEITAEWDNWISLYQRLQFYRHVLWNLEVTEWQLLIFFLCFVLFIHCRLAVSLLLLLCVCADTGTRAHLHSTAHFTAVSTDLRSVVPGGRLHWTRYNLLLSSAFRVQVAWRVEKDLRASKVP